MRSLVKKLEREGERERTPGVRSTDALKLKLKVKLRGREGEGGGIERPIGQVDGLM